ncbi:MAG: proton-coupled thiamine transporter YuaJ [Ruminococcus sp.]|nr:proton-coupled thiamine transporter YuaJ [Ruminococcus sp.]
MKHKRILPLVEGALVIALGTVLSLVTVFKLPWGGSVTLLSMLPLSLYSIKHGVLSGIKVSFIFALIQFMLSSAEVFAWGLTKTMLAGCIILDYILAFTVIGLAGYLRKKGAAGWITGTITVIMLRFLCHFTSGVVIFQSAGKLWDGFSTENVYLYSIIYNASYMLPEMIFTCIGAYAFFRIPAIKRIIIPSRENK